MIIIRISILIYLNYSQLLRLRTGMIIQFSTLSCFNKSCSDKWKRQFLPRVVRCKNGYRGENGVNKRHSIVANHVGYKWWKQKPFNCSQSPMQQPFPLSEPPGILGKFCSFRTFLTNFTNQLIEVNSVAIILPEFTLGCL